MAPLMKGLTQFIVDIREAQDAEAEKRRINLEINNIQTKFSQPNLNGYHRKKYICKLVYIHLLGYDTVDFGLTHALALVESSVFSEKSLGYLAVSTLFPVEKNHTITDYLENMLDIIYSSLIKDLQSNNEEFNCLAVQFIANCFNVLNDEGHDYPVHSITKNHEDFPRWQEIVDMVYSLCCSPVLNLRVRQKSVAALLSLSKLFPSIIKANNNWIPRILSLVDDPSMGVVAASVPLIQFGAQMEPKYFKSILPSIARRLRLLVVEQQCPEEYYYYDSPAPWLIVSLLHTIELCFLCQETAPSVTLALLDRETVNSLREVVAYSIKNASQPVRGLPNRNSQSTILFQTVSLTVFLDASAEAIAGAVEALMSLLDSAETNTRYLSLDALIKLADRATLEGNYYASVRKSFSDNLPKIFKFLADKDISVKRKSLDLLYTVCDATNCNLIVTHLLDSFPHTEANLKPDVAVKIAVLAERYALNPEWYVTNMIRLLSMGEGPSGGSAYTGNEVWERVVQIIVNNENLQTMSCRMISNLLKTHSSLESLVKVAAFVLGEYGHKCDFDFILTFLVLYDAYFSVSLITRAMLLTSFFKISARQPDSDFVPDIIDLFEAETQSMDLEIQTRAHEYLQLMIEPGKELASIVLRPFPAFEAKSNHLLSRVGSVHRLSNRTRSSSNVAENKPRSNLDALARLRNVKSASSVALPIPEASDESEDPFAERSEDYTLSPNWYSGYLRMCHYDAGIFYENTLIKITYRVIKSGAIFTYRFTIINSAAKSANTEITRLTVLELQGASATTNPNFIIEMSQYPQQTVTTKTEMEIRVKIRNVVGINESPVLALSFMCGGSFNQLNLKIPVLMLKTLSAATSTNLEEFKKRWLQIGQELGSIDGESTVFSSTAHRYNSSNIVRLVSRLGLEVVHHSPDDTKNGILVLAAGILHTQNANYGALVTIKSTDDVGCKFEIVARCTAGGVAEALASSFKVIFDGGF